MKKLFTVMVASILLVCSVYSFACAEASFFDGLTPDEHGGYSVGEGVNRFLVVSSPDADTIHVCIVSSDKENLFDAMVENNVIVAEDASWGKNVVQVFDDKASYAEDGSYWNIYYIEQDAKTGEQVLLKLEDPIDQITIENYNYIVFEKAQ